MGGARSFSVKAPARGGGGGRWRRGGGKEGRDGREGGSKEGRSTHARGRRWRQGQRRDRRLRAGGSTKCVRMNWCSTMRGSRFAANIRAQATATQSGWVWALYPTSWAFCQTGAHGLKEVPPIVSLRVSTGASTDHKWHEPVNYCKTCYTQIASECVPNPETEEQLVRI